MDSEFEIELAAVGRASVCGRCAGASDSGGEDQWAEDDVPAGGNRSTLL